MSEVLKLSENPLLQAEKALAKIGKIAFACLFIPVPLIGLTTAGFFFFRENWYLDPFLALIYALFCLGQVTALAQIRGVGAGVQKTSAAVKVLREAGDEPDLEKLRIALLQDAPPGHLRDLLLRWIELGLRGETHGSESLLDNAWERRSLTDGRTLSMHVSLNRTTLKLGFLGTLIGLIMTFPPMKRAVMSLAESDGEMRFIRDLVAAIDGDEYAILNTLVATAISILIELVTLQILERALIGFDLVNSHINDWNLTRLQPLIRRRHAKATSAASSLQNDAKWMEAHAAMNRNMGLLAEAVQRTSQQLEQVGVLQAQIGKRIHELTEYEKQYRTFLNSKQGAIAPSALRPDGEGAGGKHA
jgi:hypothetical protein